jgi:septum formation protein
VTIRFILASASPARLATLRAAGLDPDVVVSHVDEDAMSAAMAGASTSDLVARLADAKAAAVAAQVGAPAVVLGCDSMLDLAGRAYGKPDSVDAAVERWRQMRGQVGHLYTGHCLVDVATGRSAAAVAGTAVHFADVSDAEIEVYCRTGEPTHVAGAFTIDGLGGWFVDSIAGDHHNVVGVSLPVVRRLLTELGHGLDLVGYPGR